MLDLRIKEYLAQTGIHRVSELDTALIEAFGQSEGERHIERLTELFDQSEERLLHGSEETPYLRRQGELVDYLNQSLKMSLLAASFYDNVFFRRVMEYLLQQGSFFKGDICDIGCGNGILTCFLAQQHPDCAVTGLELSRNAVRVAKELAGRLGRDNVRFLPVGTDKEHANGTISNCERNYDTLFSCRTVHENIAWEAVCGRGEEKVHEAVNRGIKGHEAIHDREGEKMDAPSMEELAGRYSAYASELAVMVKPGGHLISVEHYEDDSAYAGLSLALERAGLYRVEGTGMQFSCRNGDRTAAFQAFVFRKTYEIKPDSCFDKKLLFRI